MDIHSPKPALKIYNLAQVVSIRAIDLEYVRKRLVICYGSGNQAAAYSQGSLNPSG